MLDHYYILFSGCRFDELGHFCSCQYIGSFQYWSRLCSNVDQNVDGMAVLSSLRMDIVGPGKLLY